MSSLEIHHKVLHFSLIISGIVFSLQVFMCCINITTKVIANQHKVISQQDYSFGISIFIIALLIGALIMGSVCKDGGRKWNSMKGLHGNVLIILVSYQKIGDNYVFV